MGASVRSMLYDVDPYEGFKRECYETDLQGWGSQHRIFERLVRQVLPALIIEVGTWKGASAIHMAKLCRDIVGKAEIVCVDTWLGAATAWTDGRYKGDGRYTSLKLKNGYPTLYYTFLRNVVEEGLEGIITPLPQTSDNAASILTTLQIKADLVYIDAGHTYRSVLRDLSSYWGLLKDGGVLFGDDFGHKGVNKAVLKFSERTGVPYESDGRKFLFRKTEGDVPGLG